jgi:glycosyltransferase involved in cell wall biosynthesis
MWAARCGKGVDLLLRAFARLSLEFPSARLRLAGQGPERLKLESLGNSLGIGSRIDFVGWKSPADLEPLWAEAWASLAPSLWAEPQGLVALEAIIRRVPVIASSSGGLAEMIEHGHNGLLFPNGDENALLGNLREIASGTVFPEHWLTEEVAADAAKRFSVKGHIDRLRQIFGEVIGRPGAG